MARRGNYSHKETKKPGKGARRPKSVSGLLATPAAVEVIKKTRKPKGTKVEGLEEE